jgi:hypothetical protein
MPSVEFKVGERYENEKGFFTVITIVGNNMMIRWDCGEEKTVNVRQQIKIQDRRAREIEKQQFKDSGYEIQIELSSRERMMSVEDFLKFTGISCLYHFTDERNLPLIREHGILPYSELWRRGITPPCPGGDRISNILDAKRGYDRYVHLCLKSEHPMEYSKRKSGHLGLTRFLRVSTDILFYSNVVGCPGVANKTYLKTYPIDQALTKFDLKILFFQQPDFSDDAYHLYKYNAKKRAEILSLRNRYKEATKAEIMIPSRIPQELIFNLD